MKKSILLFITVILTSFSMNGQWISEFGVGLSTGNKIDFIDSNIGLMVGTDQFPNGSAIVKRTTNGGQSWSTVYSLAPDVTPSFLYMTDVQFVSSTIAFATGGWTTEENDGLILKSTNAGASWSVLPHGLAETRFRSVHFIDDNNGFVGGSAGLYKTTDGGSSWSDAGIPLSTAYNYPAIEFASASVGFALFQSEGGGLMRTSDGGLTWTVASLSTTESTRSINFYDENNGIIGCNNGVIFYTSDAGQSWSEASNPEVSGSDDVNAVFMTSSNICHAGTSGGQLMFSSDGGQNWTESVDIIDINPAFLLSGIMSLEFVDSQLGYAGGTMLGMFLKTENGGGEMVGISELNLETVQIFPNPTQSHINFTSQAGDEIQILSIDGKLMQTYVSQNAIVSYDVSSLPSGIYHLRIVNEDAINFGRFIKF